MGIGVTRTPAWRRACGGPRQRNAKDKANTRGARSALHAKAGGRNRAITARTSTSRLSCQRIGGRRMVALLCQGTLSRKHIQAASRRRHPRQAYRRHRFRPKTGSQPWRRTWLIIQAASRRRHPRQAYHRLRPKKGSQPWRRRWRHLRGTPSRKDMQAASLRRHLRQAYHLLRPKKGSQPWRRRWLSFDSELPSWRSTPRARPLVQDSHGLGRGLWTKLRLEVLTASRQERYPAHGLWSGLARPGARIPTASGQGSHGLGPGFPRPLARAVAA